MNLSIICDPVPRIRITKAAEFFKEVIPGMHPGMDKATAFHLTVYYMVFLRNALRQEDPPIIPKLHEVRVRVCRQRLSKGGDTIHQAPVVQGLDNAIHRINHHTVDKC